MGIAKTDETTGVEGLPPPVERRWADFGFAPWVEPAYRQVRTTVLALLGPELVLGAMALSYLWVFGRLTWLQQSNFGTMDYDMGLFDQEVWLAARHLNPFLSIRGLNMWANHVNPIVYLLVPFYWIGAGPHLLFAVQTVAFAGAAVPLWLLARDRFGSPWLALGIPFAWLLYPAVEWMTWDQFHPESLGVPAFIFAYWFADRNRWRWYGLCVVLVLACKEDAAFPIVALGIVLVIRRHWRAGLATIVGALAWFVVCLELIIPTATGASTPFFLYQYGELGNSIGQILFNFVRHPSRLLSQVFNDARYRYYQQLLVPVAGLALLAPVTLLLVVPTVLENVTNNQVYPYQINYQYGAYVSAGIFLAVVEAIGRYRAPLVRSLLVGLVAVCAVVTNADWSPSPLDSKVYAGGYWSLTSSPETRTLDEMIGKVPSNAVVSATYSEVPHLSHRDEIHTWPNPWIRSYYGISATQPPLHPASIQYLVVDKTEMSPEGELLMTVLTRPGGPFRIVMQANDAVLAKRVRPGE